MNTSSEAQALRSSDVRSPTLPPTGQVVTMVVDLKSSIEALLKLLFEHSLKRARLQNPLTKKQFLFFACIFFGTDQWIEV